eukprot:5258427-Prymnesium_polylepis.1
METELARLRRQAAEAQRAAQRAQKARPGFRDCACCLHGAASAMVPLCVDVGRAGQGGRGGCA